jgi:hypothetical protein
MAVTSPSVPIMSLFGIQRSSSLFWLRRRTSCSASVPVTGGSVSAELLHQQLDLVTGIAALLAVDVRACTVRPCPWTRCRTSTRSGIPRGGHCPEASGTCDTSRHLGRTASRGVLSRRHVPPSRSRRTASRRGRSPAPLGQRAGGLRCSRLHSGVCSHTPIARPRVAAQRVAGANPGQDDPGTVRTLDPHLGRAPGLGRRFPDDRGPAAASPACSVRTSRTWIQIITGPRRAVRVPGDLTEPRPGAEDHFGIGRRAELPVGRQARTSR